MVADEDFDGSELLVCIRNGSRTALGRAEIGHRIVVTCFFEFLLVACDTHDVRAARGQEICGCASYSPTTTCNKCDSPFNSCHAADTP
jgi:hypothetical protein